MKLPKLPRLLASVTIGLGFLSLGLTSLPRVWGGTRHLDPAQVVPLDLISPQQRDSVADVIANSSFHRQGAPESFPCHPKVYLSLLNEPALTLALWQDLSNESPARLWQVGPDQYQGSDGSGTSATWEFVYRTPRLHVLHVQLDYVSPHGNIQLTGRAVLVVHTEYFRHGQAENWVKHDVDLYLKIDSKGWRAVAKTARPLIEKVMEDQVQEAGWFVSLMGRLVEMYPNWACQVAERGSDIRPEVRQNFRALIQQTRRPGCFSGRPTLTEAAETPPKLR